MTKHTNGPWSISDPTSDNYGKSQLVGFDDEQTGLWIFGANGEKICAVAIKDEEGHKIRAGLINAYLIASTPKLFSALKSVVYILEDYIDSLNPDFNAEKIQDLNAEHKDLLDLIAKAEGRV